MKRLVLIEKSKSDWMVSNTFHNYTHSLPQKTGVSPPHMLWIAHNTGVYPDALALYSPKLHETGHNETLDGDSKINY